MKIILLIFSIMLIATTVALAVFIEPKSGNVTGSGWNVPFWPFVLVIGIVLNPYLHDLVRFYLKTKVAIAQAENKMPDTAMESIVAEKKSVTKESKPDAPPPSWPLTPTDTAKVPPNA